MRLASILRDAIADALDDALYPCAVLSGGLDSSTVVSLAPRPLPTYTGYYEGGEAWDERRYAHLVARGNHTDILITPDDLVRHFDAYARAVRHLDDFGGIGGFGQWMVARRITADGFCTVLSGEGADELFGGYVRASVLAGWTPPATYANYVPPAGYPADHEAALRHDLARLPALLAVDTAVLDDFGLEGKAPFTDIRVVSYALSLPPSERVNKDHLRAAVRGLVPDAVVDRRDKMGFPAPFVLWAQEEPVRSFVTKRLGRLPDPARPFARDWWHDMIRAVA